MALKITCLMENTACDPQFAAEHGLSLYIETGKHKLLFDMGQTDAFAENALRLGVDLAGVDAAILSHGHYDHGGGMARFLAVNDHAMVYHSQHAFGEHWHGDSKYIGLDRALQGHARLQPVGDELLLDDELSLHSCRERPCKYPIESFGLTRREGETFLPETFDHEQYLLIRCGGKRVLISGCSHKGIANIVDWFHPDVLVGGFHLMKLDPAQPADKQRLEALADELLYSGTQFYTGHCTGEPAYAFLKERMSERLEYLSAGRSVTI